MILLVHLMPFLWLSVPIKKALSTYPSFTFDLLRSSVCIAFGWVFLRGAHYDRDQACLVSMSDLHPASYIICIYLAFYLWVIVMVNLDVNSTLRNGTGVFSLSGIDM